MKKYFPSLFCLTGFLSAIIMLMTGCSKSSSPTPPILKPVKPVISAISPTSGSANMSVTIAGSDFDPSASGNTVKFNGVAATVSTASATTLTVLVPSGGSTGNVTVSTSGGTANGPTFTYLAAVTPPTIALISPTSGPANTVVTITGTNFKTTTANDTVRFNGVAASVQTATATTITVLAPAGGSTGTVSVSTADGAATGPIFTYTSTVSVYACGTGINGIGYWKDGVFTGVPDCISIRGIFVSGTDVYVTGASLNGPTYWKNGVATMLPMTASYNDGAGNAIFVSGSDVYVAGYNVINGSSSLPMCWKNGVALPQVALTTPNTLGELTGVSVSGSDVFVAGYVSPFSGNEIAAYWKNGNQVLLTDGSSVAIGTGAYLSGSDFYVSGYIEGITQAYYWKNGTAMPMNTPAITGTCYGRSVYVSDAGDVYVSGDYKGLAKYWKNGVMVDLTNTQPANGISETGYTITGNGTDIYIGGVYSGQGTGYWKNTTFNVIPGAQFITGIFVK
jgi:hypothetical protein